MLLYFFNRVFYFTKMSLEHETRPVKSKKEIYLLDKTLFSFKPKLNPKSKKIALQLEKNFQDRQNTHIQNKIDLLKKAFLQSTKNYRKFYLSTSANQFRSDIFIKKVFLTVRFHFKE